MRQKQEETRLTTWWVGVYRADNRFPGSRSGQNQSHAGTLEGLRASPGPGLGEGQRLLDSILSELPQNLMCLPTQEESLGSPAPEN